MFIATLYIDIEISSIEIFITVVVTLKLSVKDDNGPPGSTGSGFYQFTQHLLLPTQNAK